ncbi:hypothetical protein SGCOL_004401 [Colletotrichum sp. CLE4]
MHAASILLIALSAVGMVAAKRDCRRDRSHPGRGWYWIVEGDTLNEIAADFSSTANIIAAMNGIPNPDSIPAWKTIVVPCPP